MRLILVTALILTSCARHDSGEAEQSIVDQAKPYYEEACASYTPSKTPRCDRATFVAAMTLMCGDKYDLAKYEVAPGVWWRDTQACAPEESKSNCSRDAYLCIIFGAYKTNNIARLERIRDYGEAHDWKMCEGDSGIVSIKPLVPLLKYILDGKPIIIDVALIPIPDEFSAIGDKLKGFTGHLTAGYLWFRADTLGGLKSADTLHLLLNATPESPWFSSLFHRFDSKDTDQQNTVALLKNTPKEDDTFGWGSSPWEFHVAATYFVLAGN